MVGVAVVSGRGAGLAGASPAEQSDHGRELAVAVEEDASNCHRRSAENAGGCARGSGCGGGRAVGRTGDLGR